MKDYSNLNGQDWSELIRAHPELSEQCDWDKFGGWNWYYLLSIHPQFANHVDWNKLDGYDWWWLLKEHPQLCNTEELQIMAVSQSKYALNLLINPSDRIKRLHNLKWNI